MDQFEFLWNIHVKLMRKRAQSLSEETKEAIVLYKGSMSYQLNQYLRGKHQDEFLNDLDSHLSALCTRHEWTLTDVPLYRIIFGELAERFAKARVGFEFVNPGYTSMSYDPKHPMEFDYEDNVACVVLVARVAKGTAYAYLDGYRDLLCRKGERWSFQSECLIHKNARMVVTGKRKMNLLALPSTNSCDAFGVNPGKAWVISVSVS